MLGEVEELAQGHKARAVTLDVPRSTKGTLCQSNLQAPSPLIMDGGVPQPNSCVEALTPDVTVFGDKTLKEVIKVQ